MLNIKEQNNEEAGDGLRMRLGRAKGYQLGKSSVVDCRTATVTRIHHQSPLCNAGHNAGGPPKVPGTALSSLENNMEWKRWLDYAVIGGMMAIIIYFILQWKPWEWANQIKVALTGN